MTTDATQQAEALAAAVGLVLPAECMTGVVANLALLAEHAARLHALPLPDDIEA